MSTDKKTQETIRTAREQIDMIAIMLKDLSDTILDLARSLMVPSVEEDVLPSSRWMVTESYGQSDEHEMFFDYYMEAEDWLNDEARQPATLERITLYATRGLKAEATPEKEQMP